MKEHKSEKVIEIDNIEVVLDRCKYKKLPFNNEENSIDKGFKDTILFLNILQFMKKSKYDKIYLFTNDKVINKFKDELQNEFFNSASKKLTLFQEMRVMYIMSSGLIKKEMKLK